MLPNIELIENFKIFTKPSKDYRVGKENIKGFVNEKEALKQAIYVILNTERYQYEIYSWNYGFEVSDLIGEDISYVYPVLKSRITEALTQDDRVTSVESFSFSQRKNVLSVQFVVNTIYGDIEASKEVII